MDLDLGFPALSKAFLEGQDIFYGQFNDVSFYVEDIDQEHLYFNLLKVLFPDIRLEKIFPLSGKSNVIEKAEANQGDKKKIFILDEDFNELLNKKQALTNIFYIAGYSIENVLLHKESIFEIIRYKNPKLKDSDIENLLDYNDLLETTTLSLKDLSISFVVIMEHNLRIKFYNINLQRDFDYDATPPYYRQAHIQDFLSTVEDALINKDGRLRLNAQNRKHASYFAKIVDSLRYIPGKYLLELVRSRLLSKGLINSVNLETFTYLLSKEFNGKGLEEFKNNVQSYIA